MARAIEKGDRFIDRDSRRPGRVIEIDDVLVDGVVYLARTEVHPTNPSAVGRSRPILDATIRRRYRRISA